MLLFVNDRYADRTVSEVERNILESGDRSYRDMLFPIARTATWFDVSDGDYRVMASEMRDMPGIVSGTNSDLLLDIAKKDPDPVVMIANRRLFLLDPIEEVLEAHANSGADITVLVKDIVAMPGMTSVYLDADMEVSYDRREEPVRSGLVDLNLYVLSKDILIDVLEDGGHISDIDPRSMKEGVRTKGYKVRSRVGFVTDLESLLEVQRTVMDGSVHGMDDGTMRNLDVRDGQILNLPVYIGDRVEIGDNCRIGPYVSIMGNVRIARKVSISNSILCSGCSIGDDCYLEGVVVGKGKRVFDGTEAEWVSLL